MSQIPKQKSYGTYYNSAYVPGQPNKKMVVLISSLIVVVAISAALFVLNTIGSGVRNDFTKLSARQNSLQAFVSGAQERIRDAELSKINGNANLLLTSDRSTYSSILLKNYGVKNISKEVALSEGNAKYDETLKEAELLNKFDTTYHRLLLERIESTRALAKEVMDQTNNKTVVQALTIGIKNLDEITKQLEALKL